MKLKKLAAIFALCAAALAAPDADAGNDKFFSLKPGAPGPLAQVAMPEEPPAADMVDAAGCRTRTWYYGDKNHRICCIVMQKADSFKLSWFENFKMRHCIDITPDKYFETWTNDRNQFDRADGPAVITRFPDGTGHEDWYVNDIKIRAVPLPKNAAFLPHP